MKNASFNSAPLVAFERVTRRHTPNATFFFFFLKSKARKTSKHATRHNVCARSKLAGGFRATSLQNTAPTKRSSKTHWTRPAVPNAHRSRPTDSTLKQPPDKSNKSFRTADILAIGFFSSLFPLIVYLCAYNFCLSTGKQQATFYPTSSLSCRLLPGFDCRVYFMSTMLQKLMNVVRAISYYPQKKSSYSDLFI